MDRVDQLVVFTLDEQQYAIPLAAVERIVRALEITPLPKAPEIVLGMVNIQGRVIPVFNIRKRFNLPEREISLNDHIILARTSRRPVALVVDEVSGVIDRSEGEVVAAEDILAGMEYVEGVVKLEQGMVLIHDLNKFLSLEEEIELGEAVKNG